MNIHELPAVLSVYGLQLQDNCVIFGLFSSDQMENPLFIHSSDRGVVYGLGMRLGSLLLSVDS